MNLLRGLGLLRGRLGGLLRLGSRGGAGLGGGFGLGRSPEGLHEPLAHV